MATVQNLKKKLQVIRSTKKLTLAMKTASTVKYSRLNTLYGNYEKYEQQCAQLYKKYRKEFNDVFCFDNTNAPICYIVIGANQGMCGAFNSELLNFFESIIESEEKPSFIFSCGEKVSELFRVKGISYAREYNFDDIPLYFQVQELFEEICCLMQEGKISSVRIVYPEYINMMKQSPVVCDLFSADETESDNGNSMFVPDKETVISNASKKIFVSILYKKVLEAALGAQAATLTTMRSAYDTACEYCVLLETQINRIRQGQVTADVIEISAEYSTKEDE
ncbi:MAG: F0F1 ATP synthase subunit gamma [Clostridia bacterium]|nr:F0F1 ATP synthase subunit gamma [Clostridia bacterium]